MASNIASQTFWSSSWGRASWSLVIGIFGLGIAMWFLPSSPLSLVRADILQGLGHTSSAVAVYDEVSQQGLWESTRLKALHRSAMLWSLELDNPTEARKRWESLAKASPYQSQQAAAWKRVADFSVLEADAPKYAAQAYERAANLSEQDEIAAAQWLAASSQWTAASDWNRATQLLLTVVERYPDTRSEAYVALGQISISRGQSEQALSWFENAVDTAQGDSERGLAKLGVAISLERLGILEEAIAELNDADLPDDVRDVRRRKMQERNDQLQMD